MIRVRVPGWRPWTRRSYDGKLTPGHAEILAVNALPAREARLAFDAFLLLAIARLLALRGKGRNPGAASPLTVTIARPLRGTARSGDSFIRRSLS
jgi:hypothetical protein